MTKEKNEENRKERCRIGSRARHAAINRLISLHPTDFEDIYAQEAKKAGITTHQIRRFERDKTKKS